MKSSQPVALLVFVILILTLASGCKQQDSEWKGTVEVVDGVTVVKNPSEPKYGDFQFDLEEDLILGGDPDKDEYYFPRRVSLAVDDQRNLYVLDVGNFRIQRYNHLGQYLLTIGQRGQGPGEFQYPSNLSLDAEGNIWVFDSPARALKVFSTDGTYMKSIKVVTFIQPQVFISQEGFIFGWRDNYRAPGGPKFTIQRVNPDGAQVDTVAEFQGELKSNQSWFAIHYYSSRIMMCPINPASFCYGFSSEYKLYIADGKGNIVRTIERFEEPIAISSEEKEETGKEGIYATIGRSGPPEDGKGVVFPTHRPYFGRISVDGTGRIYVWRLPSILENEEEKSFDVFGVDGSFIYRTTFPFSPALIKAGFVYEIRTDEETGEITIVRHKCANWNEFKSRA